VVKIQSQGGRSLADMYDVQGSIAGIEELEPREVQLVHEMGSVLFSERFRTTIRTLTTGAIAQNTDFEIEMLNPPSAITRVLGIKVIADVGARVLRAQVSANDPRFSQDFPLWVFSQNVLANAIAIENAGAAGIVDLLLGEASESGVPSFVGGTDQPDQVRDMAMRGRTTAFGAGTVTLTAIIFLAFTFTGGVSAFGAKVPSW